jgi:hypothetical protein
VEVDGSGRPAFLRFPVHTLRFPPGVTRNYRPPTLELYLQLQGGLGTFRLRVKVRRVGGHQEIAASPPFQLILATPGDVDPIEARIRLNGLVFPNDDVYEFLVYANEVNLSEPREGEPPPCPAPVVAVLPANGMPGGVQ